MLIKKIKKFIKSPVKFFTHSLWFSTPYFDNKNINGNVIVVTTLGQLNQAESIIKFNKIDSPTLVIMYTTQNMRMPNLMYKMANKALFRSIYLYELPLKPGKVTLKKYLHMKRGYQKLIESLKPQNLYVMSFSGHYATLLNLAKNKNITLHLVEEGTATYAPLTESFSIPLSKLERFLQKGFINEIGYFDNFDELHIAFPDYGKKIFKAKKYSYFLAHMSGVNLTDFHIDLSKKYNITENDYIYVSQIFPVDDDIYYSAIINYLERILESIDGNIFIKLHPKEMERRKIMHLFLEKSMHNPRLVIMNEPPFLIDPFIYLTEPKGIIGITSTALVYAPLLVPEIKTVSIAQLLISELRDKNVDVSLIEDHFKILQQYDFISIIDDVSMVADRKNKFKLSMASLELIVFAEKAYREKNYYLAIFYWKQAFINDVSLLGNKALWYCNALNKIGQIYKIKKSEVDYINKIKNFNKKDNNIWSNIKSDYKVFFEG